MLRKIWQWLKQFFQRLFTLFSPQPSGVTSELGTLQQGQNQPPPLTDTDYEFLFSQLLEGVAEAWDAPRILRFFEVMGERGTPQLWLEWLQRFGERLLASPSPNYELAQRMVRLGEITHSLPSIREIGEFAYNLGVQLLTRGSSGDIWEYDGPDIYSATDSVQTISLEELMARLQQDPALAEDVAQQLGLESNDPQAVIVALVERFSEGTAAPPEDAETLAQKGLEQAKAGDFAAAIASWDRVLELQPDFPQVWYNRGLALVNLGQLEAAISSYDRAVEIRPDDYLAWNNRGETLRNMGRLEEAIASYDQAISLKSDFYNAWYNRGLALKSLDRLEAAIESWDQVLKIKPDLSDAWKSRGNTLKDLGRIEEATASLEKAKELKPDS